MCVCVCVYSFCLLLQECFFSFSLFFKINVCLFSLMYVYLAWIWLDCLMFDYV